MTILKDVLRIVMWVTPLIKLLQLIVITTSPRFPWLPGGGDYVSQPQNVGFYDNDPLRNAAMMSNPMMAQMGTGAYHLQSQDDWQDPNQGQNQINYGNTQGLPSYDHGANR
jgi:hypothetical protein